MAMEFDEVWVWKDGMLDLEMVGWSYENTLHRECDRWLKVGILLELGI